jgi:hypothetical protein
MHEMGIASSVLEAVHRETHRAPGQRATKVGLRIGEYAGVDQESLRFCFEVLAKELNQGPLELEIDYRPASDDLAISFIELEDAEEEPPPSRAGFTTNPGSEAGGESSETASSVRKAKV